MEKMLFSKTHEYAKVVGNVAYVGISDFAQKALGNIVYVDMPEVDSDVEAGEDFGAVESVKAASDLISPVTGAVVEINEHLIDNPGLINQDAENNWILKVELSDLACLDDLLDREAYDKFCEEEGAH